jgi:hypothetical protein
VTVSTIPAHSLLNRSPRWRETRHTSESYQMGRTLGKVDDAWEFGQVLSVVMKFVNLKEVLYIF